MAHRQLLFVSETFLGDSYYVGNFIGNLITDRFTDGKSTPNKKKFMFYSIYEYNISLKKKPYIIPSVCFLI